MAEPTERVTHPGSPSLTVRTYDRRDLRLVTVVAAVAGQVWPLLAFAGLLLAAAVLWSASSGDRVLLALALGFARTVALGLVGAFALHEVAHVVLLRRIATVRTIVLERTAWRFSVVPRGAISPPQAAAVAVAGPAASALVGVALRVTGVDLWLSWWFLAHAAFLLPVFGDGRALVIALWRWRTATADAKLGLGG